MIFPANLLTDAKHQNIFTIKNNQAYSTGPALGHFLKIHNIKHIQYLAVSPKA